MGWGAVGWGLWWRNVGVGGREGGGGEGATYRATSKRQAVSVPCAAVAADLLEALDVEADLLLQRRARAVARRVVRDARGVELAPEG